MLTIEQLRSLPDLRAKFQAITGLTWDPTSLEDEDFLKMDSISFFTSG